MRQKTFLALLFELMCGVKIVEGREAGLPFSLALELPLHNQGSQLSLDFFLPFGIFSN